MGKVFIELSPREMYLAGAVAVARRVMSIASGLNKNKHAEISDWNTDVAGCIAEQCFAKHFNVYWNCSVNSFKAPDVGRWQVRSTAHRDGCLIVRPNDEADEQIALLITERMGAWLIGWFTTGEAKQDRFWRVDRNSWWVPQIELREFIGHVLPQQRQDGLHERINFGAGQ